MYSRRLQSMGSLRVGHDWATSLSCIGEGNGNPLQCSCLENPRDWGAWWAAIHWVAQSRTWLKRLSSSVNYIYHVVHYTHSNYLSYNWKFGPFDCFLPIPCPPTPTFGNHKSDLFYFFSVCLFLKYHWPTTLCWFLLCNTVIWHFHTFQNGHHDKSRHNMSPYKGITSYWLVISHAVHSYLSSIYLSGNFLVADLLSSNAS